MQPEWISIAAKSINKQFEEEAKQRQDQLTKPLGSLGELETIAIRFSAMQATATPKISKPWITVFAGDHGVVDQQVSAFPQSVTVEMIKNFSRGGAAINVLAEQIHADLEVINTGTVNPIGGIANVLDQRVGPGTGDISHTVAMTSTQLYECLNIGRDSVIRAKQKAADLFIAGEMGIGNTTTAASMVSALLDLPPEQTVGTGTGINSAQISHKQAVVARALELHQQQLQSPMAILQCLGGFEIAAMTGAFIRCAQQGLAVMVDGYIASAAALAACKILPSTREWLLFAHQSGEIGHKHILEALRAKPLLNLGMRLGEGTGAALAVTLVQQALALFNNMATFTEAGVSEKN